MGPRFKGSFLGRPGPGPSGGRCEVASGGFNPLGTGPAHLAMTKLYRGKSGAAVTGERSSLHRHRTAGRYSASAGVHIAKSRGSLTGGRPFVSCLLDLARPEHKLMSS